MRAVLEEGFGTFGKVSVPQIVRVGFPESECAGCAGVKYKITFTILKNNTDK